MPHALYQPYKYLIYGPILALSTVFLGLLCMLIAPLLGRRAANKLCVVSWARLNLLATPVSVRLRGLTNIEPGQSYVVVSNHQSHFDILILYGHLDMDLKWVMKKELRRVPFIGACSALLGHIFVDRANHRAALRAIEQSKDGIRNGTSIMFFPEGTRSRSNTMLPFKKGAFKLAIEMQLPVLPITLVGSRQVLPSDTIDLRPGKVDVIVHAPIVTAGMTLHDASRLMQQARACIAGPLDAADALSLHHA